MNFLLIDTSGDYVEIVIKSEDRVLQYINQSKEMASIILLSQIEKMCKELEISLDEMDYFSTVIGPGSFTGIRIGVATVRAFCQSLQKKAIAVNRLDFLAYNNRTDSEYIVSVVDGKGGVAYISVNSGDAKEQFLPPRCIRISDLPAFLCQIEESFCVVSDSIFQIEGFEVTKSVHSPDQLIAYVEEKIRQGQAIDYTDLEPLYIRKSQAERSAGEL